MKINPDVPLLLKKEDSKLEDDIGLDKMELVNNSPLKND